MQIICLKCFRFSDAVYSETVTKHETQSIIIQPSKEIQDAPDWIKNDPLFAAAIKAGDLQEVAVLSKKAKTATTKTEESSKTGWGEAKLGLQI